MALRGRRPPLASLVSVGRRRMSGGAADTRQCLSPRSFASGGPRPPAKGYGVLPNVVRVAAPLVFDQRGVCRIRQLRPPATPDPDPGFATPPAGILGRRPALVAWVGWV